MRDIKEQFIELVLDIVEKIKQKIELEKIKPEIEEVFDYDIEIKSSENSTNVKTTSKKIFVKNWNRIIWNILSDDVFKSNKFLDLVTNIDTFGKEYLQKLYHSNGSHSVIFFFKQYLFRLLNQILKFGFNKEELITDIDLLKKELSEGIIKYNIRYFIFRLYLESDSLEIYPNVFLRKPLVKDFKTFLMQLSPFSLYPRKTPELVLEIDEFFSDDLKAQTLGINIMRFLRLYTNTNAYYFYSETVKKSILYLGYSPQNYNIIPLHMEKYIIRKNEEKLLKKFISILLEQNQKISQKSSHLKIKIALDKFEEAMFQDFRFIKKLSNAVIGLETLYMLDEEEKGIKSTLSKRIAEIISCITGNYDDISKIIGRLYFFRSKDLHGNIIKKEWEEEILKLTYIALEYLRVSLIIFLCSIEKETPLDILLKDKTDHKNELKKLIFTISKHLDYTFDILV